MESILGNYQLNLEALKEPRGFIRCLQWFFAMIAFATLADFSTELSFDIACTNKSLATTHITSTISYPFRVDQNPPHKFGDSPPCGVKYGKDVKNQDITFPGSFASDAQFFVFTGVVSWLYCFVSIAIYVLYSSLYMDNQKQYPRVDFLITALLAMFWLAGSAAWANGLTGLKLVSDPDNWIWTHHFEYAAICFKTTHNPPTYLYPKIKECVTTSRGHFGGANVSVLLGFLNFFLWASNLWFLYKETNWFKGGKTQQQEENTSSEGNVEAANIS
eukprot:GFUD01036264.1.p1 GENE.GFUD01036264.1~~GFUD01036264.1.p1  ORF type:complete len:288 (+),score=88.33 GFUD01036264.1:45-866(+)